MDLLKKLTQTDGASGNEFEIAGVIAEEIMNLADELITDDMGNLIAIKHGGDTKIMLSAHIDEIGIVVTYIDDKGFIRFSNVGGLYVKHLIGRRVRFKNGTVGVISAENTPDVRMSKLYIDIGAKNEEEAAKVVSVGDTAVFEGEYRKNGDIVISKALDNRAGAYVLIEAMKQTTAQNTVYFVFSVQEEVGLRGAKCAAYTVEPDYALAVDVTDVGDTPECEKMAVKLGGGAAVKVMDRSIICDSDIRTKLIELAKNNNIPYQLEVMNDGGTDAGAIQVSRSGVKTGGVSIPTRYIHSPSEMASMNDIDACVKLVSLFCNSEF